MPAELMPCTVAMLADALPQLPDLIDELLARHLVEVRVHDAPYKQYCRHRNPDRRHLMEPWIPSDFSEVTV